MPQLGPAEIPLDDKHLAMIGRATALEAQAKTFISLALKRLNNIDHAEWIERDKRQFGQIVDDISGAIEDKPKLKAAFSRIKSNHERWRESRNVVVHTIWGTAADGEPEAHCYRRKMSADQNDIVRAVNDCWWLAKECRHFAYAVAEAVVAGELEKCREGKGFVHISVDNQSVTF